MKRLLFPLLVAASLIALPLLGDDLFRDDATGLSLAKPAGWLLASKAPEQGTPANARRRIVRIAKYPDDHTGPNPSFTIDLQPLPLSAPSPRLLLLQIVPNLRKALPDAVLEAQPRDVTIDDPNNNASADAAGMLRRGSGFGGIDSWRDKPSVDAAEMIFRHTAKDSAGKPFEARSRMMYIMRRDQLLAVQMTAPASGPDASAAELRELTDSIRVMR